MSVTSHLKVTKRVALAAALAAGLAVTGTSTVMAAAGGSSAQSPQQGGSAPAVSKSVTPGVSPPPYARSSAVAVATSSQPSPLSGTPQILTGSTPVNLLSSPLAIRPGRRRRHADPEPDGRDPAAWQHRRRALRLARSAPSSSTAWP